MRILEFCYDFIDIFVDRQHFEYCEMDTDSAYMAIASESLSDIIKLEFRSQYDNLLNGYCSNRVFKADNITHWFPHTCCSKLKLFDKRTPGLFKKEF